jgi:hypothetical protein
MSDDPGIMTVDRASPVVQPLFGVVPALPENIEFDMKPVWTAFDVGPSAFPAKLGGFADPSQSPHAKRKSAFDSAVRGFGGPADRIWFFRGENFIRYFEHPERRDDISGWLPIAANGPGLPANFTSQIDAVLTGKVAPYEDHVWLFRGNQYPRYDPNNDTVMIAAQPIAGNFLSPSGDDGMSEYSIAHQDPMIGAIHLCPVISSGSDLTC